MSNEVKSVDEFIVKYNEFKNEIAKVIVGQEEVVDQVLISIFSRLAYKGKIINGK